MKQETMREIQEHHLKRRFHSAELLRALAIPAIPPLTTVLDDGLDPLTIESHFSQTGHLTAMLKIDSVGWLIAEENAIRQKVTSARRYEIPVVTGSALFGMSYSKGRENDCLELCSDIGIASIELDHSTVQSAGKPRDIVGNVATYDLRCIAEIILENHTYSQRKTIEPLVDRAKAWLDAGGAHIILGSVEKWSSVHMLAFRQTLNYQYIDAFAHTFGLHSVIFDASTSNVCKLLIDHFGKDVRISGVRFERMLDIESYRRGLYSNGAHHQSKFGSGSEKKGSKHIIK